MGYGLLRVTGSKLEVLDMDAYKLPAGEDGYARLELIYRKVTDLILQHHVQHFAIEAPFFGKNVQSMLKLGRAQGVAIAAALQAGIPVSEYAPRKIKQSITGNGNAAKEQVMLMLQRLLHFNEQPQYLDASDAMAVAVCHHFQQSSVLNATGGKGTWKAFLSQNPGRVSGRKAG